MENLKNFEKINEKINNLDLFFSVLCVVVSVFGFIISTNTIMIIYYVIFALIGLFGVLLSLISKEQIKLHKMIEKDMRIFRKTKLLKNNKDE